MIQLEYEVRLCALLDIEVTKTLDTSMDELMSFEYGFIQERITCISDKVP